MSDRSSEERKIENEAIFRQANESIQKGIDEVNRGIMDEGDANPIDEAKAQLYFYCECSDENCRERVRMTLENYTKIHENRRQFILKPDHEVSKIETILEKNANYIVVRKLRVPPESPAKLQVTDVSNV